MGIEKTAETGAFSSTFFVQQAVGNGWNTSFCFDFLHPVGPLYSHFSTNLLTNFVCNFLDKVDRCVLNDNWTWPQGRKVTGEVKQRMQSIPTPSVSTCQDHTRRIASASGVFNGHFCLKAIRRQGHSAPWCLPASLGKKSCVSVRFHFIWLLCKKRLNTVNRLKSWEITVTHEECVMWEKFRGMCGIWEHMIHGNKSFLLVGWVNVRFQTRLAVCLRGWCLLLLFTNLWEARNAVRFQSKPTSAIGILESVVTNIHSSVCSSALLGKDS